MYGSINYSQLVYNMVMKINVMSHYRMWNMLHSFLLPAAMLRLPGVIGCLVAGPIGVICATLISLHNLSSRLMLFLYRSDVLPADEFRPLIDIFNRMAQRLHLTRSPVLYNMPSLPILKNHNINPDSAYRVCGINPTS